MQTRVVNVHKEPYDICIMRPSIYGNPFPIIDGDRDGCIKKFRKYFYDRIIEDTTFLIAVLKLWNKRIGCCCAPKPCHGDVYVKFFNDIAKVKYFMDLHHFTLGDVPEGL